MNKAKEEFGVRWQIEDGYIGGSRPQYFNISERELAEDMEESELRLLFRDNLKIEFEYNVHPVTDDEDAFVEWAKERIEKMRLEEY